jgi:hypothetical protein
MGKPGIQAPPEGRGRKGGAQLAQQGTQAPPGERIQLITNTYIFPMFWMVSTAFKPPREIFVETFSLWPSGRCHGKSWRRMERRAGAGRCCRASDSELIRRSRRPRNSRGRPASRFLRGRDLGEVERHRTSMSSCSPSIVCGCRETHRADVRGGAGPACADAAPEAPVAWPGPAHRARGSSPRRRPRPRSRARPCRPLLRFAPRR